MTTFELVRALVIHDAMFFILVFGLYGWWVLR